ncbi:lytic transglycosylase domain-containing protein [Salmonella enterica]|nr:lytic transglycosylase domain-containing protein [Salmonella enterica]
MAVKIPISAEFNAADVKKQIQMINDQIKNLSNMVAMSSKQKFEPISLKSKEDLAAFTAQMQKLLKIQTELKTKLQQTGQAGVNPLFASFGKMYGQSGDQLKKMRDMLQFLGVEFSDAPAPKPPAPAPGTPPPPPRQPPAAPPRAPSRPDADFPGWKQTGMGVVNAGLRAAGPVGGVVSQGLGGMMSGGAAAGMMGLVGGLAALFVGKLVGAIAEKVKDAQVESITIDRIIRQTGGNSSYKSVRNNIRATANALGVSYNEMAQFGNSYARTSNIGPGQNIAAEMYTGGALSRAYGLDMNSGLNFMGSMRGANITQNDQGNRRIGLVIGETLAKAGVFGKADEMLQAVTQFAVAQARMSLVAPDIAGYGGSMASLLSSKTPGLDVAGAGAMLSHVNQSIQQGGNAGDAGQFMFQRVANRAGLNPFQSQVMREGGMFATADQMFGEGSQYAQTFGGNGPSGNKTMFQMTMDEIKRSYPNKRDQIQAMSRLFGIGTNQAMALSRMNGSAANNVGKRLQGLDIDINDINMSGIQDLGRVEAGEHRAVAYELLGREGKGALSQEQKDKLVNVMKTGSTEDLKDMEAALIAEKGQMETEGSKTRDTIEQVGNAIQDFASNLLPVTNDIRAALVAGFGLKPGEMRQQYLESEHEEKMDAIDAEGDRRKNAAVQAQKQFLMEHPGPLSPEDDKRLSALTKQIDVEQATWDANREAENVRFKKGPDKGGQPTRAPTDFKMSEDMIERRAQLRPIFEKVAKEMDLDPEMLMAIAHTESHFDPKAYNEGSGATGLMQLTKGSGRYTNRADMENPESNIRAGAMVWKDALARAKGDKRLALRYYNGGYDRSKWGKENAAYADTTFSHYQGDAGNITPDDVKKSQTSTKKTSVAVEGSTTVNINVNNKPAGKAEVKMLPKHAPANRG